MRRPWTGHLLCAVALLCLAAMEGGVSKEVIAAGCRWDANWTQGTRTQKDEAVRACVNAVPGQWSSARRPGTALEKDVQGCIEESDTYRVAFEKCRHSEEGARRLMDCSSSRPYKGRIYGTGPFQEQFMLCMLKKEWESEKGAQKLPLCGAVRVRALKVEQEKDGVDQLKGEVVVSANDLRVAGPSGRARYEDKRTRLEMVTVSGGAVLQTKMGDEQVSGRAGHISFRPTTGELTLVGEASVSIGDREESGELLDYRVCRAR